jgi:putative membrane-bound dehydrogenase-like protein
MNNEKYRVRWPGIALIWSAVAWHRFGFSLDSLDSSPRARPNKTQRGTGLPHSKKSGTPPAADRIRKPQEGHAMRNHCVQTLLILVTTIGLIVPVAAQPPAPDGFTALFDGRSLEGWEGKAEWFRVRDGAIVAGTLGRPIPNNEFLCTKREYDNFVLKLKAKLVGPVTSNAGIQIRSKRVPNHHEVEGYQVDMAIQGERNIWGALYDESRRRVMLSIADQEGLSKAYRHGEFNEFTIRCEGRRIRTWVNGYLTVDYTEPERNIPQSGIIGLQIHSGPPSEAIYSDIYLRELNADELEIPDPQLIEERRRDPDSAVDNLQLMDGLEATLFASEPMIQSPTNIDVDHRGRVWVCEVTNYRGHAKDNPRTEGDRILILEDTDGDGRADLSKVFYEGRDIDSAQGIAVLGHRVIVTSPPNVFVFTDEDGDDLPDSKDVLFSKTGLGQNDHSTHSFSFGPDGRLYWNMGNGGLVVHNAQGELARDKHGRYVVARGAGSRFEGIPDVDSDWIGGMALRCNLDGSELEVLGHNFRNNYELVVDAFGNVWQSDNDDDGNRGCRVNYVMQHGNYGYRDEVTSAHWREPRVGEHENSVYRHWHQNDPGVVPNVVHTGAGAPAGILFYEGRLLPETCWDQPILCDAGTGAVRVIRTTKSGAGFHGDQVDLVRTKGDRWMRPADVAVAPDGSLLISDWYDPVVGWNRQDDRTRGRIFRIAPKDHAYQPDIFSVDTAKDAVAALGSPNAAVRYLAWSALRTMGQDAESALQKFFDSPQPVAHRARALWLLARIPDRGPYYLERAAEDPHEDIRLVALRAADQLDLGLPTLVRRFVNDTSPRVRGECAVMLRDRDWDDKTKLWAALAAQHDGHDRWYLEALGIGAHDDWASCLAAYTEQVGDPTASPAGRDIVWRSRATQTVGYLERILSQPIPSDERPDRYVRAFDFQPESEEKEATLRNLATLAPRGDIERHNFIVAESLLRSRKLHSNSPELATVRRVIKQLVGKPQFVPLAQRYGIEEYLPDVLQTAIDFPNDTIGITALSAILESGHRDAVEDALNTRRGEEAVRLVRAVGNSLRGDTQELLAAVILAETTSHAARQEAVRALARTGDGVLRLVKLARAGQFPEQYKSEAGLAIARTLNVGSRNAAEAYFPLPAGKNDEAVPQMTELLTYVGDPAEGKRVFSNATCVTCHKINNVGTEFGPDLSEIGGKLSKRGLYEAILDPSNGIAKGFEHYQVVTEDGVSYSALKLSETDDTVTVRVQNGGIRQLSRGELEVFEQQPISIMPAGLVKLMSVDEMVDLVEYLGRLLPTH